MIQLQHPHPATLRADDWLHEKLAQSDPPEDQQRRLRDAVRTGKSYRAPSFINPFSIGDLLNLDDATLRRVSLGLGAVARPATWALALQDAPVALRRRLLPCLACLAQPQSLPDNVQFTKHRPLQGDCEAARQRILDALFWDLIYWSMPEHYEALTTGECLHPGIFANHATSLRGATVLDVGAGTGRATFACLEQGAARVIAVEPSPGLRHILRQKIEKHEASGAISLISGTFEALPLPDASVDITIACSAFTSAPRQGGAQGLAELRRVTRPGGSIVIIWPLPQDFRWLAAQGMAYVALPATATPGVRFADIATARAVVQRFYGRNQRAVAWIAAAQTPWIPYNVLEMSPPHDYCWMPR